MVETNSLCGDSQWLKIGFLFRWVQTLILHMASSQPQHERSERNLADRILRYVGAVSIALVALLTVVVLAVLFPLGLFESSVLAPLVFTLLLVVVFVAAGRFGRRRSRPVIGEL